MRTPMVALQDLSRVRLGTRGSTWRTKEQQIKV